jgi:hypothetical protein
MADGRGGSTVLAALVGRAFGLPDGVLPGSGGADGPAFTSRAQREAYRMRLLPAVMAEPPIRLAGLAPLVSEAARDEDAVATAILREAADQLTETVRALGCRPGERLVATGGLIGAEGPLAEAVHRRLDELGLEVDRVTDGCGGAVALARLELEFDPTTKRPTAC